MSPRASGANAVVDRGDPALHALSLAAASGTEPPPALLALAGALVVAKVLSPVERRGLPASAEVSPSLIYV